MKTVCIFSVGWIPSVLALSSATLFGQNESESLSSASPAAVVEVTELTEEESARQRMVSVLMAQLEALHIKRDDVAELENQLGLETNEISRADVLEKLQKATDELRVLEMKFRETASGVDLGMFEEEVKEPFSLENEFGKVAEPFFAELREATSQSRKMTELRDDVERFSAQAEDARTAIAAIEGLLGVGGTAELQTALSEQLEHWQEVESLASSQEESARLQLENLEAQREGFVEGSTKYVRNFVQKRGLNLVLGIGAALAVFFFVRGILFVARKFRKTDNPKNFGSRVFVLAANLLSVLGGLAAMMAVFSVTGDVFLFSFVLLFLLGVAWSGLKVLPQFVDSLKLILNIGMVKEGERIVFDDIPWNVESLGFTSKLANSKLDSAYQLLPVRHLVGYHSRPWCEGEEEFPCKRGDWVQLSDGRMGKTVAQNPGHVVLEELGGAQVSVTTPDFLALSPRNLSLEGFRVETRFGVDYKHQAECTTSIPQAMEKSLSAGLREVVGAEAIQNVQVQFASAGASSLDYEIEVDLAGSAAADFEKVQYALQRILVDCCNENGWEIPFQQITVHRAPSSD